MCGSAEDNCEKDLCQMRIVRLEVNQEGDLGESASLSYLYDTEYSDWPELHTLNHFRKHL